MRVGFQEAASIAWINRGKWRSADIIRIEVDGRNLSVKSFAARHMLVRTTIGRFLTGREVRALRRLAGLPGIPSGVHRLSPTRWQWIGWPGRVLRN